MFILYPGAAEGDHAHQALHNRAQPIRAPGSGEGSGPAFPAGPPLLLPDRELPVSCHGWVLLNLIKRSGIAVFIKWISIVLSMTDIFLLS